MPISVAMHERAKQLVAASSTATVEAFAQAIAAASLETLTAVEAGVEWWLVSVPQKTELLNLVPAGANQAGCRNLLSDYTLGIAVDPGVLQPFVTGEFDRSGWLQYYLTEAAGVKNKLAPADQRMLQNIMGALFYKKSKSGPPGAHGLKQPLDAIDNQLFRGILYELLVLGFDRIPATREDAVAGSASDAAIIGKMMWAGDATEVSGTAIKTIKVKPKWRGDSRDYDTIKRANGFVTKAHSEVYARDKNLSAAWHPLNSDLGKRWLWFRKTATDNCLYTIVSVGKAGKEWKTYLPYPLIKLSGGKVEKVWGYQGEKKVKCLPAGGGAPVMLDLPVTVTYLYLFVLAGLVLDTGAMQGKDAYPEVGVGSIPFKNVFGAVKVVRYHLGDKATVDDNAGVLVVTEQSFRNDDDYLSIKASYGQELFTKLGERFDSASRQTGPVAVKWAASGDGFTELSAFGQEFTHGGARYRVFSPLTVV